MSAIAAASRPPPLESWLVCAVHRAFAQMAGERDRWILWVPVLLGVGVAIYFGLSNEPPAWVGPVLAAGAAVCAILARGAGDRSAWLFPAAAGVFAVAAGFAAAQIKAVAVGTVMLNERLGPTLVTGRVDRVESFPDGQRLTLRRPAIARLTAIRAPELVRIRLRGAQPPIRPGDRIRVRAVLTPPPAPAVPGAYDFQRQAYFDGLGGVGYSVGSAAVLPLEEGSSIGVGVWFARLRTIVGERIQAHLDGATAAVTTALLNGEQRAIPDATMAAIRDSGLAHLLSISGLHIGMVAAIVLFAVRGGLALAPPIALRFPIKKWAAVASVFAAGAYTLLAAAPVPSQRSFLMIAVVLLAILADRQGISMRLLAFAASVVLITQPEAMLGPSFQMSFAAVMALMAAYEYLRERPSAPEERTSAGRRALVYLAGVILTTLIAGTATAPFAVYHFNRFQVYGLAANMIAVPVTGFWIMPWAVLAFLLMPSGLEGLALAPLSWGVDVVIWVAEQVASWPGAVVLLPAMPIWSLGLISLGGIWLCIWRGRQRWLGLGGILFGLMGMLTVESPDLLVDGSGRLLATATADGGLLISSKNARPFDPRGMATARGLRGADRILAETGCQRRPTATLRRARMRLSGEQSCRCYPLQWRGVARRLSSRRRGRQPGAGPRRVRFGAHPHRSFRSVAGGGARRLVDDRPIRVESVANARGDRPWVVRPRRGMSEEGEDDTGADREAPADAPSRGAQ